MRVIHPNNVYGYDETRFVLEHRCTPMQFDASDAGKAVDAKLDVVTVKHDVVTIAFSIHVTQDSLQFAREGLARTQSLITGDPSFLRFTQQMVALLEKERREKKEQEARAGRAENECRQWMGIAKRAMLDSQKHFGLWKKMVSRCRALGIKPSMPSRSKCR